MAGNAGRAGTSRVDASLVDHGPAWDGACGQPGRVASELSTDADRTLAGCGARHVRRSRRTVGVAALLALVLDPVSQLSWFRSFPSTHRESCRRWRWRRLGLPCEWRG